MKHQVVRSIILPTGIVTAHADGSILFRQARGGEKRTCLNRPASVMLACFGPQGRVFRLLIGDRAGVVHILSLPNLSIIEKYQISNSEITALALHEASGRNRIIAGTSSGEVITFGEEIPSGHLKLFSLTNSIGLIRSTEEILTIHSGWTREVRHWNGDIVTRAKRWFTPPTPPNVRHNEQLTLAEAVQA